MTDAHVHVWTDDYAHYPLAEGKKPDPIDPRFTAEKLLSICKPAGVDRIVLIQAGEYGVDNDYMLDMIKLHPGVFSGVAVIEITPAAGTAIAWASPRRRRRRFSTALATDCLSVGQTMRDLQGRGVRGFRIIGHKTRSDIANWLDGAGYHDMFATAAGTGQSVCCLIDPEAIPALDRMCKQYPHTPVVVDHMARIGVDGQVRDSDVDLLCSLARHSHVRAKISAFYALGAKTAPYVDLIPMIRRLYGAYGSRRLMWASDSPYQVQNGHTYTSSLELVRDRCDFLSADDKDWMLAKTAEQVFF